MECIIRGSIICILAIICVNDALADDTGVNPDITALRAEVDELRTGYNARIAELERRLAIAEQNPQPPQYTSREIVAEPSSASSDSAFNPAIGVIFQGQAWHRDSHPNDYGIAGFPLGGEAGSFPQGLGLGEVEINISANVDDKFTAWLTVPVVVEGGEAGVEIEEAWIETTALPGGFSSRFGRFFSAIGYLNNKHAHAWDFADQPLPYQAFLGGQYLDDGVQLRWIAPTDLYIELGAEVFRGDRFPITGASHSGFGSNSVFINVGGDLGVDHSWLAGLSHLHGTAVDRPSGDENDPVLFSGDSDTSIAQFVWKWAPNRNRKARNLVVQGEFFWNTEDGDYTLADTGTHPYDNDQNGWYVQAIYQPFPRWRFGTRIDGLSKDNPGLAYADSALAAPEDDPVRYSLMADWSNSEFSRLRLQYSRDETGPGNDNQWGLQYTLSIGAHGGHSF